MSAGVAPLPDWDPRFTRYFPFSTLTSLGYRTRVSVSNASASLGPARDTLVVSLSLYDAEGHRVLDAAEVATVEPGGYCTLDDVEAFAAARGVGMPATGDLLGIVHQAPGRQADAAARRGGTIETSMAEIAGFMGMADDFVEYVTPAGDAAGGVFYQGPPLNDPRLSTTRTAVAQSPAVLFDDDVSAFVLLLNVSCHAGHDRTGRMEISLFGARGERIGRGAALVPPFASRVVALGAMLDDPAYRGGALFLGVSTTATLVPLVFMRHQRSGALAIDHTLPPPNYHPAWADGGRRAEWAADLTARVREGRL